MNNNIDFLNHIIIEIPTDSYQALQLWTKDVKQAFFDLKKYMTNQKTIFTEYQIHFMYFWISGRYISAIQKRIMKHLNQILVEAFTVAGPPVI